MVRLLLEHGADPNAAYHSLSSLSPEWHATWQEEVEHTYPSNVGFGFACGRVVQLVMQLGHRDVVDALLEGGADIGPPHPEWPVSGHFCPLVPRSMYLKVAAGLEEAARTRGG
ncbi:hypothetical protein CPLU01_15604 [Colletotrichum plurivorum]|uniref:Ankyrin repeat protein n=1 Tax=Colletotrichum plurivorum TaxID=2175906 RepID=A0A8H6J9B3_9PEZI|nr:hypothetical protein CPLU01_15604 [Colletotrichum plurivorum]